MKTFIAKQVHLKFYGKGSKCSSFFFFLFSSSTEKSFPWRATGMSFFHIKKIFKFCTYTQKNHSFIAHFLNLLPLGEISQAKRLMITLLSYFASKY